MAQCHGEKIPDWWGSGQNIHRQTPPSAAHRKEQHNMWRAATQREGSVTVLPSTSRWGGLVSDPGPPWSSNSQSPHRDDASGAQTSHKSPYIFSFILVLSVITLWNKAEPQPLHWCQPSSIRRRGSVGCWMWSTRTFERALNQLTMPSLTCPWRSIILSPKQAKWSFEDHDGEVIEPYRTETSARAHTPSFFGLEQDLLYCGLEGARLVLLQHLPVGSACQWWIKAQHVCQCSLLYHVLS